MHASTSRLGLMASVVTAAKAVSLSDCTTSYVAPLLPTSADDIPTGITIDESTLSVATYSNYSVSDQIMWEDAVIEFCEVSFSYSHQNLNDSIYVTYYLPPSNAFANRFLATGGAAYTINNGSGGGDMIGGVSLGAVTGYTDAGMPYYGGTNLDDDGVFLLGNGTVNWPMVYNWAYMSIAEMTHIGKTFTSNFYGLASSNSTGSKLYSYYTGCSEGGREGMSQVQKAPELYDGIIAGAPAMRYAHQQVNHLIAPVQVKETGYYPGTCELELILNATIAACDPLDGKTDGVVARSDLCSTQFNVSSLLGKPYSCAASSETNLGLGYGKRQAASTTATPAQNGTVSAEAILVVQTLMGGLKDSEGRQVYLPFQPGAGFGSPTVYDSDTGEWTITNPDSNGEWVTKFLQWTEVDSLDLTNVTYDDLRDYMTQGLYMYSDSLQTTQPDLTEFLNKGGKLLHYHGEADTSIPPASSIRYHESVRKIMYPDLDFDEGNTELNSWYRFYLVPGAAHCATNDNMPNAGFPRDNFNALIQWVEEGVEPTTINATVVSTGVTTEVCAFPLRPYWTDNSTMSCLANETSVETLLYDLDAFKMPIY